MKKLFLMLAAVAALTFVYSCDSCKKSEQTDEAAADSLVKEAQEGDIQDPEQLGADLQKALDEGNAEGLKGKIDAAKEWAQGLLTDGKAEQAKGILEKVQSFLSENAEKVTSVIGDNAYVQGALDWVKGLNADEAIQKLGGIVGVDQAVNTAKDAANAAGDAVTEGVDKAKEAVAEPVEKAKEKVEEVVDKGNEAIEAAKNEVNKVADKTNDAVNDGINKVKDLVK